MRAAIIIALLAWPTAAGAQSFRPGGGFTGGTLTSPLVLDATNTLCSQTLSLAFAGDLDTGMQRNAANTLWLCAGAANPLILTATTLQAPLALDVLGNSTLGNAATDTLGVTGLSTFTLATAADAGAARAVQTFTWTTPADTAGTNTHYGLRVTPTIGNATGGTNTVRGIAIDAVTGDAQVTLSGIDIGVLTGTAAAENAVLIGTGWDAGISNGSPYLQTGTTGCVTGGFIFSAGTGIGWDGATLNLCVGTSSMLRAASTVLSVPQAGITFKPRHLGSVDTAMGDVLGGTCTLETVVGTNTVGTLTATCTIGQTLIATFGTAFDAAPDCLISNADADASTSQNYVSASTTTTFTITANVGAAAAQVIKYWCVQPS